MNPFYLLENFTWFTGTVIVFLFLFFFTLIGLLIVRKHVSIKSLKNHHDFAGFVFANLGVLYAVLLGFTVVNVQDRYNRIEQNAQLEANYLIDLWRDAEIFSDKDKTKIRGAIKMYTSEVINKEWGGTLIDKNTRNMPEFVSLWDAFYNAEIKGTKQEIWYKEAISKLNLLTNARINRLLGGNELLKGEMWAILILGGISMMAFTWFFGIDNLKSHLLIIAFLAATTASLLFLIYSLDTAFAGRVNIAPDAFTQTLEFFKEQRI